MWRGRPIHKKTANICNQFLIQYLSRKKKQLQQIGVQRKAYVYQSAIVNIKKYPLPIISSQQLKLIYGIGQLLCEELMTVIKSHYRDFLKDQQNNLRIGSQHFSNINRLADANQQENSFNRSNSQSLAHTVNIFGQGRSNQIQNDDSKSSKSIKSATMQRSYKPRPKTQAAYIMIQIKKLGNGDFVSEEKLKQILKHDYNQNTGRQFTLAISSLQKNNFILKDPLDSGMVKLTQFGLMQTEILENKTKVKNSQAKIHNILTSFKQSSALKQNIEQRAEKNIRQLVETKNQKQLILIIDNREIKDKQQQCFFETRLQDKFGITCKSASLPLGDFLWLYGGKILDYIVQRKKADDLASSIIDGRYKEQKYRLKNSGFTNIYYLFEGHLTGTSASAQKQVSSALLKTRVKEGFKVVQVNTITESVKFLSFMTNSIREVINNSKEVHTLGTIQEFNSNNAKSNNLTVEQIFGLSLKTIPGVGKLTVNEILKYFSSFRSLYNQLSLLSNRVERIEFIKELLKGCGVQKSLPQILVDLLFDSSNK